jgi:hypothetical protein
MSKYEQSYGTDWQTLDVDEAVDRAYALGVAASMGEYHPDELEAIRKEVGSAYERSVVDLAFDEGKNEGKELDIDEKTAGTDAWEALVDEEPVTLDREDIPTGGRSGIPEAVDKIDAIELPDLDSTEPIDKPDFLERD